LGERLGKRDTGFFFWVFFFRLLVDVDDDVIDDVGDVGDGVVMLNRLC
jgi:hypothetical protein